MSTNQTSAIPGLDWHQTLYPMLARARPSIPVFYSDLMVAPAQKHSPSASKPRYAVESWRRLGLPLRFVEPTPASREEIALAHDRGYVDGVLDLQEQNGFGTVDRAVAESLPFTSGAMIAAAREAVANGHVAVAPVSGFHQARYMHGGGFCTFNGLIVAAMVLRRAGLVRRVGILDCDHHEGDGSDELIRHHGLSWIEHITMGKYFCLHYQAKAFLALLPKAMEILSVCDVILYQAGVDPHIHDPLGGWLSSEQLRTRDRLVFEATAKFQVPIAWCLAGGYQEPVRKVLKIHDATMEECSRVFAGASIPGVAETRGRAP